jgi:predicted DsbA family dithiol-disulfide isomerase
VTGVPKTIVNDDIEILGALPPDAFIEQALAPLVNAAHHDGTNSPA